MTIRFTARTIEQLCDSVRRLVDEVRRHEREIHRHLCVDKARMPRQHFIKDFPGNEGSHALADGRDHRRQARLERARSSRLEPPILELQARC